MRNGDHNTAESSGAAKTVNGASSHGKDSTSNGEHDPVNGVHNGLGHTNGLSSTSHNASHPSFFGHDREEVTRILIQGLSDLGYEKAADALSTESGFDLETSYAAAFRQAILSGDWPEAETLLFGSQQHRNGNKQISEEPTATVTSSQNRRAAGLTLAEDASKDDMLFLIRRQKYLELLEMRDLGAALNVLQHEIQGLHLPQRQLHSLSSLMMYKTSDDVKSSANWDGALGDSRRILLSSLSRSISPSVMIPEHRLAELLMQVRETQVKNCTYHNSSAWPSLYMDHKCEREDFPLNTLCELDRHQNEVWVLQFSNDGTKLATAGKDSNVIMYETTTFNVLHVLSDHHESVANISWSPDDSKLISCSQDKEARVWDTKTGTCLRVLKTHTEPVTSAAWAPDGQSFVTGSLDKNSPLCIWSTGQTATSEPIHNFVNSCFRVQDCAIAALSPRTGTLASTSSFDVSSSGTSSSSLPIRLVVVCTDHSINVFDYTRREKLSQISMDFDITCLNLSRDGTEMLINLSCHEVWALGVEDGECKQKYRGQKQGTYVIRSCFGGAREGFVVSGGEDSRICIWHRHSGRLIEQLEAHRGACINAVAWNMSRPEMFASAGDDFKVRVYANNSLARRASSASHINLTAGARNGSQDDGIPHWGSEDKAFSGSVAAGGISQR